jgi:branched-chain amino acid transport system permease protein
MRRSCEPMTYFLQQIINSAVLAGFYGLLAVSYVLMHGITGRVNLAFGALSVWAGAIVINATLAFMSEMPGATLLPVLLAAGLALGSTAALGAVMERLIVRPLVNSGTLAMMVATLGLAIVLEELIRLQNNSREIWLFPILNEPLLHFDYGGFDLQVSTLQVSNMLISLVLSGAVVLLIGRHAFGRAWRAVAQDGKMAELCGVDTGRTLALTFFLATGLTASAGAMLAVHYGSVSFYGGLVIGLKTLFVAVVGGLSSISGAYAGAVLLALVETFWSAYIGTAYRDVAAFALLTMLLILMPRGLSGDTRAP